MKEIYFKSFGYLTEDKQPAFGCLGLAVEYNNDEELKVIKTLSTIKLYKNIKNSEEATIAAGLDILNEIKTQLFIKEGERLSFCITSSSLYNYYAKFYNKSNLTMLLTNNQNNVCNVFNNQLNYIKNDMNLNLDLCLGIKNRRSQKGIELLSSVEDFLIEKLQSKIDAKSNWIRSKREMLDSEINEIDANTKVIKSQLERMTINNDYFSNDTVYDNEYSEKMVESSLKQYSFSNADKLLDDLNKDISFLPRLQYYF